MSGSTCFLAIRHLADVGISGALPLALAFSAFSMLRLFTLPYGWPLVNSLFAGGKFPICSNPIGRVIIEFLMAAAHDGVGIFHFSGGRNRHFDNNESLNFILYQIAGVRRRRKVSGRTFRFLRINDWRNKLSLFRFSKFGRRHFPMLLDPFAGVFVV